MRAMVLEFGNDPTCDTLDRQYMIGDSVLVAPIFDESGIVSYYLPAGTWTHFLTGEKVEGDQLVQRAARIHEHSAFRTIRTPY